MFERNIGNVERIIRLFLGALFAGWVALQPHLNGIEWFVMLVSLSLILNGIFSRCYFWYILDINTCARDDKDCIEKSTC